MKRTASLRVSMALLKEALRLPDNVDITGVATYDFFSKFFIVEIKIDGLPSIKNDGKNPLLCPNLYERDWLGRPKYALKLNVNSYNGERVRKIISPSEAVLGFASWLSNRKNTITFGSGEDVNNAVRVSREFNEAQEFDEPSYDWDGVVGPLMPMDQGVK